MNTLRSYSYIYRLALLLFGLYAAGPAPAAEQPPEAAPPTPAPAEPDEQELQRFLRELQELVRGGRR